MKTTHFLIFLTFYSFRFTHECDIKKGPEGESSCIIFKKFGQIYQLATFLPNKYIQLKTKNKHLCENTNATFCFYSCMADKYGFDSGEVFQDCLCNKSVRISEGIFLKVFFILLYLFL